MGSGSPYTLIPDRYAQTARALTHLKTKHQDSPQLVIPMLLTRPSISINSTISKRSTQPALLLPCLLVWPITTNATFSSLVCLAPRTSHIISPPSFSLSQLPFLLFLCKTHLVRVSMSHRRRPVSLSYQRGVNSPDIFRQYVSRPTSTADTCLRPQTSRP